MPNSLDSPVWAAGINSFYDYLFGAMRSLDRSSAIASLPPQLRMQLLVAINMRTLSNVRMAFGHVARGHAFMHACTDRALHTQMY